MWLFTKDGFYSAVENFIDNDYIHVRSRWKEDLEKLEKALRISRAQAIFDQPLHRIPESPGINPKINSHVMETPDRDYPYRIDVTRDEWNEYLKKAASEINYSNFKEEVYNQGGDSRRLEKYHEIWSVLKN